MNSIIYPDSIAELDNLIKGKILCFLAVQNHLLVGLNNGMLLIYEDSSEDNLNPHNEQQDVKSDQKQSNNKDKVDELDPLNSPVTLTSLSRSHSRESSVPPSSMLGHSHSDSRNHLFMPSPKQASQQKQWQDSDKLPKLKVTKQIQMLNNNKPINELRYLKDVNYLFVQLDSYIHIFIYSTFKFQKTIDISKGVTMFKTFSQLDESELRTLYDEPKRRQAAPKRNQLKSVDNANSNVTAETDLDDEDVQDKLQKIDSYSLYQNFYDHDPFFQDSSSSIEFSGSTTSGYNNDNLIHSHLVFAVRRKLYIYSWTLNDPDSEQHKEVTLSDRIKNFEFMSGSRVVVGLNSDFVTVDLKTLHITPLIIPNTEHSSFIGSPFSTISLGGYKHIINLVKVSKLNTLISRDSTSVKINSRGELLNKSTLNWITVPEQIYFLFPYLILVTVSQVEIRDLKNGYLLQTIPISNVLKVTVDNFKNAVYILNNANKIMKCSMRSYIYQLNKLEQENKLSEAINLTFQLPSSLLPDKISRLRQLQIKKAESLFRENKFQESMLLFSNFLAPPDLVLSLFPRFITGNMLNGHDSKYYLHEYSSLTQMKYSDIIAPSPGTPPSPSPTNPSTPTKPRRAHKKTAPTSKPYITNVNFNSSSHNLESPSTNDVDSRSITSYSSRAFNSSTPTRYSSRYSRHQQQTTTPVQTQNRRKLLKALQGLLPFLADTRRKLSKMLAFEERKQALERQELVSFKNDSFDSASNLYWKNLVIPNDIFGDLYRAAELVDTTLFNCYLITSPGLIGPLVRVKNHCNVEIVEKTLLKRQLFKELVDFYYGKGHHAKALQLLLKLGKGEDVNNDSLKQESAEVDQEENGTKTPTEASSLNDDDDNYSYEDFTMAFNSTINTNPSALCSLRGPLHTVQYLTKLSQDNIDLIFKYIEWPMEVDPDRSMIVFMADSSESESLNKDQVIKFLLATFPGKEKYSIAYLEHVIDDLQDLTPRLHTQYIELLLEVSVKEDKDENSKHNKIAAYDKLIAFLSSTSTYEPRKTLRILLNYEKAGSKYLYLKTFIYRRLEDHQKVLDILVYNLENYRQASEYCSNLYSQNEALGTEYFHILLSMYLVAPSSTPSTSFKPNLPAALSLLSSQGSRMSAIEVLKILPLDLPVSQICRVLSTQFKLLQSRLSQSRMRSSLSKVQLVKCQEQLLGLKSQSVLVTENRICAYCNRKLGHSVLSVFTGGQTTHYGCARAYQNQIYGGSQDANEAALKKTIPFGEK